VKKTVYLSLGSNVGDRAKNLQDAIAALGSEGVRVVRVSSTYETEPVDYLDQPWFLNSAVETETKLTAPDLLRVLRGIETPELQIPHPRMHLRRFVLEPLAEIAPNVQHPVSHLSIADLLARTPDKSAVRVAAGLQPSQLRGAV
jgi:7,8-dihydro-6-hydroxymethylpterin-pyrophosphokinase